MKFQELELNTQYNLPLKKNRKKKNRNPLKIV